jgi:hypothetical protein
MPSDVIGAILQTWSEINPVAGYTSGFLDRLDSTVPADAEAVEALRERIVDLQQALSEVAGSELRTTAACVLTSLATQLKLTRPSGAGPSGTGMSGVYAAADGIFYVLLKGDQAQTWVEGYLEAVAAAVKAESQRWSGQDFSVLVRRECLNTVGYARGTLAAMAKVRPDLAAQCTAIGRELDAFAALFDVPGLSSQEFATYWPVFQAWDRRRGPTPAPGYPQCLRSYYQLPQSADQIGAMAQAWLGLDLPVLAAISAEVQQLAAIGAGGSLQDVWQRVSDRYAVDFDTQTMQHVVKATDDYGRDQIVSHGPGDRIEFAPTPDYLVDLVTGGEDFAVDYLHPPTAYSELYLTAAKNTSMLTMINILVHEASHGYNFVLSARRPGISPLLNLNTALEVPMTEGQAFWREFEYWAAAARLLRAEKLDDAEAAYLALYGQTAAEQADAVLCAQLETYIWRVVRYVRAACDVEVNSGWQTYTDFIAWAAAETGLSEEFLHGECFTFMASPGYAPCYAVGGVAYARIQAEALAHGVTEVAFNTTASAMGFSGWPTDLAQLERIGRANGT